MYFHYSLTWFLYISAGIFLLMYGIYFLRVNRIAKKIRSSVRSRIYIKFALRIVIISCVLFALLGPSFGDSKKEVMIHSKNILFLMDVSLSMNTRDVSPSRIEKARTIIHNIVDQNSNDQFGLILYTSGAAVQCPFTNDKDAFLLYTQTAYTALFDHSGSNPYDAFREAQNYLKEYNREGNKKPTILVLLTDGEGMEHNIVSVMNEHLFSEILFIGIGSETGARIPFQKSYKKDANGEYVLSMLNSEDLITYSKNLSASYFEVSDNQNKEPQLYAAIRNYTGSDQSIDKIEVAGNKYFYFLILALALTVLDILFTVKTITI